MRTSIITILIFSSLVSHGQIICPSDAYALLNGKDTINKVVNELQQGYWINYEKLLACYDCNDCKGSYAILKFKILSKGNYERGLREGKWAFYSTDCTLNRTVFYNKGIIDSTDTYFDQKGSIVCKALWRNGQKCNLTVFYEDGNIKYKGLYKNNCIYSFEIYYPNTKIKYRASEIVNYYANKLEYFDFEGNSLTPKDSDINILGYNENLSKYIGY